MKKTERKLPRPFIIMCAKCYEEQSKTGSVDYAVKLKSLTIAVITYYCIECKSSWEMDLRVVKDFI